MRIDRGDGMGSGGWKALSVDLDRPIPQVATNGASHLHVTAFAGATPLGTMLVPAPIDPLPAALLADELGRRFAWALHRERLRAALAPKRAAAHIPLATLVVCTRDRPVDLQRCLAALGRLADPDLELLVVDNGARPAETRALVEAAGACYVREPVPGLDRARNRAITQARGEVVLFTDDDVEVGPEWANRLLRCFDDPLVMAATGLVLPAALDARAQQLFETHASFGRGMRRRVFDGTTCRPARAGVAGAGASMAVRASFLRWVNGFPEELDAGTPTHSGGDTYLLYRVLRAGFRIVYEPSAVAYHTHRDTEAALRATIRGYGTGACSYLAHAAISDHDVGAALSAFRWGIDRLARNITRAALRRRGAPPLRLAVAEAAGALATVRAYPAARRQAKGQTPILPAEITPYPEHWLHTLGRSRIDGVESRTRLPRLSVVIPSYSRRDRLLRLLRGLDRQRYPDERLEVIVCLDGDPDGSGRAIAGADLRRQPRVLTLANGPQGAAVARNHGAATATGDVLLFLDDDIVTVGEDLLRVHATAHGPACQVLVGPCPPTMWEASRLCAQRVRNWWVDHARRLVEADALSFTDVGTGNLSVTRSVFDDYGGFAAMPRREDWEFGYRLLRAGVKMRGDPAALALHDARRDLVDILRCRWDEGAGDARFVGAHPQVLTALPLGSWPALGPRRQSLACWLMEHRPSPERLLPIAACLLGPLEAADLRHRHCRALGVFAFVAYWSGVGAATGGAQGWLELVAMAQEAAAPPIELDLTGSPWRGDGASWAANARITFRGHRLATVPMRWGGFPWDLDAFVTRVVDECGWLALQAEVKERLGE